MLSIQGMPVFMRTTGKILEESLIFLIMKENSVHNGRRNISFKLMQTVAKMIIVAGSLMDGRSRNIILLTIRSMLADKE